MQAGEVNPRGHAPTLSVACVPHNPIGAGGLYVIHERPQVLTQGIVDVQAHGSVCVQAIGDDGARVEGVGKVGRQARRLLGRRFHAKQLCGPRPGAPSIVARVGVRRQHRARRRLVLRRVERRRRAERRRRVGVRGAAARVRPRARALGVLGPHLHLGRRCSPTGPSASPWWRCRCNCRPSSPRCCPPGTARRSP